VVKFEELKLKASLIIKPSEEINRYFRVPVKPSSSQDYIVI